MVLDFGTIGQGVFKDSPEDGSVNYSQGQRVVSGPSGGFKGSATKEVIDVFNISTTMSQIPGLEVTVAVEEGQAVLILLTIQADIDSFDGGLGGRIARGTTVLGTPIYTGGIGASDGELAIANHFLDIPGEGNFTYNGYGDGYNGDEDIGYARITAVVLQ